jgi:hypothetical protein
MTITRILSIAAVTAALSIHPVLTAGTPGMPGVALAQTDTEKAAEKAKADQAAAEKAAKDAAESEKAAAASKAAAEANRAAAQKAADEAKAAADKATKANDSLKKPQSYEGEFLTPVLADGEVNELRLLLRPENLLSIPVNDDATKLTFKWVDTNCAWKTGKTDETIKVLSKISVKGKLDQVGLLVWIPERPCYWPLTQRAHIMIQGRVAGEEKVQALFNSTVSVSVTWIPMFATVIVLALIYPGCAVVAWYLAVRRHRRATREKVSKGQKQEVPKPRVLESLDPIQITATQHGRASLAKLQIFGFSLLVFGLLFYYQIRYGLLSGMSKDVLYLMGISAGGAMAGKITYTYKRRLSLEAWNWLVEKGWLPKEQDEKAKAKWSELVLDGDNKEFDVYSFQMAAFSVVVAIALVNSGVTGLGTFEIPGELLGLMGLSQAVYIGGKAAEASPYKELEEKVSSAIKNYNEFLMEKDQAKREVAWKAFKKDEKESGEMFLNVYGDQLPDVTRRDAKDKIARINVMQPMPT